MKNPRTLLSTILLAGALAAVSARAAKGDKPAHEGDGREARVYSLNFTGAGQAMNLVRAPCEQIDKLCRVDIVKDMVISVLASPEAQTTVADLLRQVDLPPRSQTFHIMVLAAGMQDLPKVDLPEGAARALAESSRLLPFKGYRMLEQGLVTTTDRGRIALGDPESGYEALIRFEGGTDPASPLLVRSFEMVRSKAEQVGDTKTRRTVIDTSFTIKPGETVVLGASRLDVGNQALMVLVTAVAPK